MDVLINFVIRLILHIVFLTGIVLLVWPLLDPVVKGVSRKVNYRYQAKVAVLGDRLSEKKVNYKIYDHIDSLLYLVKKDYQPGISFIRFMVVTVAVFVVTFTSLLLTIGDMPTELTFGNPFTDGISASNDASKLNWQFPFFGAFVIALVPYIRLRYMYSVRKVKGSYDLLDVVRLLSKFTHLSVDVALEKTSQLIDEDNVLKRPLMILSNHFSGYSNEDELKEGAMRFSNSIGTTFSINFVSDLMYYEKEGGLTWKESLLFLMKSMEEQRITIMDVKNSNRDAIMLGFYGNLIVFLLLTTTLALFLKPHVYFDLQFKTQVGLWGFVLISSSMFLAFIFGYLLSRPKLDYH